MLPSSKFSIPLTSLTPLFFINSFIFLFSFMDFTSSTCLLNIHIFMCSQLITSFLKHHQLGDLIHSHGCDSHFYANYSFIGKYELILKFKAPDLVPEMNCLLNVPKITKPIMCKINTSFLPICMLHGSLYFKQMPSFTWSFNAQTWTSPKTYPSSSPWHKLLNCKICSL